MVPARSGRTSAVLTTAETSLGPHDSSDLYGGATITNLLITHCSRGWHRRDRPAHLVRCGSPGKVRGDRARLVGALGRDPLRLARQWLCEKPRSNIPGSAWAGCAGETGHDGSGEVGEGVGRHHSTWRALRGAARAVCGATRPPSAYCMSQEPSYPVSSSSRSPLSPTRLLARTRPGKGSGRGEGAQETRRTEPGRCGRRWWGWQWRPRRRWGA